MVSKFPFYSVILAGGIGERLWPYSSPERPKQIIPFLNGESLLTGTINRCKLFSDKIFVITSEAQKDLITEAIEGFGCEILVEPAGRNTAPAIIYSLLKIKEKNANAIVGFFPADHHIPDSNIFSSYIKKVQQFVAIENKICLLGLKPKHAATGYGYIEVSNENPNNKDFFSVNKFHEKPCVEVAEQYLQDGNKFWNLGIFIASISSFIDECKIHASEIFDQVEHSILLNNKSIYEQIAKISIDYAVMEKSENIVCLPIDLQWSDVGNLDVFMSLKNKQAEFSESNVFEINSKNNLVDVKKKLVALIGVEDLCIVEHDGILLISKRNEVEKVKDLRLEIKQKGAELSF